VTIVQTTSDLKPWCHEYQKGCLSQIALKRGLHRSTSPSSNLPQSDPPPVDLSVGDIRWQIAAEWLEIAQWSQWRAYRKPPSLFRTAPYEIKMGVPNAPFIDWLSSV